MKIFDRLSIPLLREARYAIQKPNTRDVHQVARMYKQFTNHHIGDSDLWKEGKPSITQHGTISQGFTSLDFTFQNQSSDYSMAWVRNFVGSYSLPYSDIWVLDPQGVPIEGNDNEYTRVTIKYAEHEPDSRRSIPTPIIEARYPVRNAPTWEEAFKIYKQFDQPFPYEWENLANFDSQEGGPLAIEVSQSGPVAVGLEILFHWDTPVQKATKWIQDFIKEHNLPHTEVDIDRSDPAEEITWSIFVTYSPDKVNLKEARYAGRNPSSIKVYDRYYELFKKYEFNQRHGRNFIYGENFEIVDVDHGDTVRHGMANIDNPQNVALMYIIVYKDSLRKAVQRVKAWLRDINLPYTDIDVEDSEAGAMHVTVSYVDPN